MTDHTTRYTVTVTPKSAQSSPYTAYFDYRLEADVFAESAVHDGGALSARVSVAGYLDPLKIVHAGNQPEGDTST